MASVETGSAPWTTPSDRRPGRPVWRLWAPVVVSFLVQVPATAVLALHGSFGPGAGASGWSRSSAVVLALAGVLCLLAARRSPGPTVAAVAVLSSASMLTGPTWGPPAVALAFAAGSGIVRGARGWAYPSLGLGWALALTVALAVGWKVSGFRVGATTALVIVAVLLAEGLRTRREQLDADRRRQGERRASAAQEERVRIARELHDVVAHSLAQITVQAGMGLHLMDTQPERAREALTNIKGSSKASLDEVRGLLDVLRGADAAQDPTTGAPRRPGPDLEALPVLVQSLRDQGVDAVLELRLVSTPGAAVQQALYRIAQESVTNVLRHAQAGRVSVELVEVDGTYRLLVEDDGVGGPPGPAEHGNGLLGMTERAELLGGTLETGRSPLGGFRVTARVPVRGVA
ncbi:sensor histidine kinase [Plantibacter sp. CFBP 8798]|uniref:sensor histidine kinase n=1 Tax=Plantibacter sp. CFBP 8798 TaxID=2775268 RepID=UPI001781D8BB|nr:sensor histidine kinase [Plantibacter sp. CFBP 8798]MBD8468245.1 sensor histidine kinase [Plantibacter sp. CFBP 8798]